MRLIGVVWAALGILATQSAWAQEEIVYLDFRADEGCPSRTDFVEQVRGRTPLAHFVDAAPASRRFEIVACQPGDGRAFGYLTTARGGQAGAPREVAADDCATVVSALALIAALAIDPHASTAAARGPRSAQPTPSPAPAGADTTTPSGAGDAVLSPPAPATADAGSSRASLGPVGDPGRGAAGAASMRAAAPPHHHAWVGLRAGGWLWFGETFVPMGAVSASAEWEMVGTSAWGPAARISATLAASPSVRPPTGDGVTASFSATTARLDLCPVRLVLVPGLALRPCAGVEGGALTGDGTPGGRIRAIEPKTRAWWALHEGLRLQLDVGRGWRAEVEAGASEPLSRDRFVFETPEVPILEIPRVTPTAALGLGYDFW